MNQSLEPFLVDLVGDRVSSGQSERKAHSLDYGYQGRDLDYSPDVVVYPKTTDEVRKIIQFAHRQKVPVTAWGAGTSLEGNAIPLEGGVVLDFRRMNRVLDIRPDDLQVTVEPGVTYQELNSRRHLGQYGLFFPPDPGANATLGGMIGNGASGTKSVKYGVTADYVQALEVVVPPGRVIRTGSRAPKSASGYDLTHLFVGSEGTLGLVTEITLRIVGRPSERRAAVAYFSNLEDASRAVSLAIRLGLNPSMMELIDAPAVGVMNRFSHFDYELAPVLLVELDGATAAQLEAEMDLLDEVMASTDCDRFIPLDEEQYEDVLTHRHELAVHIRQLNHPESEKVMDVAVPISAYPLLIRSAREILKDNDVKGYIFGHAGDGNVHVHLLTDDSDDDLWARTLRTEKAIIERTLELKGTITGEHGVGLGRRSFLRAEHGEAVETMKQLKDQFDPNGILNPGKIFE